MSKNTWLIWYSWGSSITVCREPDHFQVFIFSIILINALRQGFVILCLKSYGQCNSGASLVLSKAIDWSGKHTSVLALKLYWPFFVVWCDFPSVYSLVSSFGSIEWFFFFYWNGDTQFSLIELASTLVFLVHKGVLNKTSKPSALYL